MRSNWSVAPCGGIFFRIASTSALVTSNASLPDSVHCDCDCASATADDSNSRNPRPRIVFRILFSSSLCTTQYRQHVITALLRQTDNLFYLSFEYTFDLFGYRLMLSESWKL